jgi:hypothetical protein
MNKHSIILLLKLPGLSNSIIKRSARQYNIKPLATKSLHGLDFQFWGDGWHEDCSFYHEFFAAVGDSLCVVACRGGYHATALLLLG